MGRTSNSAELGPHGSWIDFARCHRAIASAPRKPSGGRDPALCGTADTVIECVGTPAASSHPPRDVWIAVRGFATRTPPRARTPANSRKLRMIFSSVQLCVLPLPSRNSLQNGHIHVVSALDRTQEVAGSSPAISGRRAFWKMWAALKKGQANRRRWFRSGCCSRTADGRYG
jgi:hypothetical protein